VISKLSFSESEPVEASISEKKFGPFYLTVYTCRYLDKIEEMYTIHHI
jgi:hypothetical protein